MSLLLNKLDHILIFLRYGIPSITCFKLNSNKNKLIINKQITLISFILNIIITASTTYHLFVGHFSNALKQESDFIANSLYLASTLIKSYLPFINAMQYKQFINLWNKIFHFSTSNLNGFNLKCIPSKRIAIGFTIFTYLTSVYVVLFIANDMGINRMDVKFCMIYVNANLYGFIIMLQYYTFITTCRNWMENLNNDLFHVIHKRPRKDFKTIKTIAIAYQHIRELILLTTNVSAGYLLISLFDIGNLIATFIYYLVAIIFSNSLDIEQTIINSTDFTPIVTIAVYEIAYVMLQIFFVIKPSEDCLSQVT